MKLQDIFDLLASNELSQLSIGGQGLGVINDQNYKSLVGHVNLGLTELHKRFHLKEGTLVLALQPNQLTYLLRSEYAVNVKRSQQQVRYIQDTLAAPFRDDIIKVKRVTTEKGFELPLNNIDNPLSCTTPTLTTLEVPDEIIHPTTETPSWLRTSTLKVAYQAMHPLLAVGTGLFDPNRVDIELPYTHVQALLWFIASRVNNPVGMSNEFNAGNNYWAKFEAECTRLAGQNIQVDQDHQTDRVRQKGFP